MMGAISSYALLPLLLAFNPTSKTHQTKGQPGKAGGFLWKIDSEPPSFVFGTIHAPYHYVWEFISDEAKEALNQAEVLYTEVSKRSLQYVDDTIRQRWAQGVVGVCTPIKSYFN